MECKKKQTKHKSVWFLMKTLASTLNKDMPIWAAYNSLLGKKPSATAAMMLPVVNGTPTNWDNLCRTLKEAVKLRESVYCGRPKRFLFSICGCISSYTVAGKDGCQK